MKKNLYAWFIPFTLLLFLLSGCVTSSVVTESNAITAPDAKLAGAKTFNWFQPVLTAGAAYEKGFSDELDKNLRTAIEESLKLKGIQKVNSGPDVLIAYDVSVAVPQEKDRAENYMEGFGYGYAYMAGYRYTYINPGLSGYRPVDLYKQGTLIIDLIDPATNQLIWRGWAEGAVTDADARYPKIQQQVMEVLKKLTL